MSAFVALLLSLATLESRAQAPAGPAAAPGLPLLYERLERALVEGRPAAFLELVAPGVDREAAAAFAAEQMSTAATRAVVRERDREAREGAPVGRLRLLLEVFVEFGARGSVRTWRVDVEPAAGESGEAPGWRVSGAERLSSVEGLHRLALSTTRQFRISDLTVQAEDLTLTMAGGTAHAAETPEGVTGLVLLGQGELRFAPAPASERGQVRLVAGDDELRSRFDAAFLRLNPYDFEARISKGSLVEEPADPRSLRRAQSVFDEEAVKSFGLDLVDLSRDHWSLVPPYGDFLAEVRTARFGTLTYARSGGESEDITVFDRKRRRNLSVYASRSKLAARGGRFFNEDEETDYDVEHYALQVQIDPRREWVEGRAELRLRVRAAALGTLTLRLAESLVARSITAPGHGRLLSLRVKGQNSVVVNLPQTFGRGDELTLVVSYGGRLPGATPEREVALAGQEVREEIAFVAEPRTVYSHRSYWYPQATVTDYATAMIRITVPESMGCVATGVAASGNPVRLEGSRPGEYWRLYVFNVERPARYFATVVTRLEPAAEGAVTSGGTRFDIQANPRQVGRGRALVEPIARLLATYGEIVGDHPYPTFTLALVDDPLPGGHSPAYFALLHQPLPTTPYTWRNDPVSFDSFPQFFLAHEVAHQFWGNAVGWENYHEQWISEGFAQYFAVLYAEKTRPRGDLEDILKKLRQTATANARHGPVWLGYRLGHLQADGRIFRAVVYNKSALVLHMLRRWLGDGVFFRGVRRLYRESRFVKIGTGDVQRVFEQESGQPLERFFTRWILEDGTPAVHVQFRVEAPPAATTAPSLTMAPPPGGDVTEQIGVGGAAEADARGMVVVRLEQRGEVFDLPVTVTLQYAGGQSEDLLVRLSAAVTEVQFPLRGVLRGVELNRDSMALVELVR